MRVFDQMQNAGEVVGIGLGAADVDKGGILEPVLEQANDARARRRPAHRGLRRSPPSAACVGRYA